jgi:hypothetical protein
MASNFELINNAYVVTQDAVYEETQPHLHTAVEMVYAGAIRQTARVSTISLRQACSSISEGRVPPRITATIPLTYQLKLTEQVDDHLTNHMSLWEMEGLIQEYGGYDKAYRDYCEEDNSVGRLDGLTYTLAHWIIHTATNKIPFKPLVLTVSITGHYDYDIFLDNSEEEEGEGEGEEEGEGEGEASG